MSPSDFNYELFFNLTPDLLCIAGFDGYFKKVNPAVLQVLGYSEDELFSRPINDFIHPEDQLTTQKYREQLHVFKPLLNFENRYLSKSGEIIWLSWTSMPVQDQQLVFAIAKNITYKKRLEEDRNTLLTQVTRINSELMRLNYVTSHDLRAPVNNLLSVFDLLDPSKIQDENTLELMKIIKVSSQHLKDKLNGYIDNVRAQNALAERREVVSLSEILQEVLSSISHLIESKDAKIEIDFSAVDEIIFNREYLESIYLNLITNSLKYAQPGLRPHIRIFSENSNKGTSLTISDNGLGFDLAKVGKRIFGLNQTFHDHPDAKGVGLYLVYNHVQNMGGKIEVESEVNQGTRFRITFP